MKPKNLFPIVVLVFLTSAAAAQSPAPPLPVAPETAALSQGWSLLAQGDDGRAATLAQALLTQYPSSAAVLAFAVEVEIVRGGALSALGTYEGWLGGRTIEDAYVLRRIARALLREMVLDRRAASRLAALNALIEDGDVSLTAEIEASAEAAKASDALVLGSLGQSQAVNALIEELQAPMPNKQAALAALAKSRSPLAVAPIAELLGGSNFLATRVQAAEALGQLGLPQAIPELKPLLDDRVFPVKFAAASALYALGDPSATALLREMLESDLPTVRLSAARAMRGHADTVWLQTVQDLARDEDPDIRRQAAELLGPHDEAAARAALEALFADPNPAIREAAGDAYLRTVSTDISALRKALRRPDPTARVLAANRLLQLTR